MGSVTQDDKASTYVTELDFAGQNLENSADLADWRHPVDHIEPEPDSPAASAGVEALQKVMGEVFRSKRGKVDPYSAFNKFLSLTWVIRPDLLDSKSLMTLGEETGVTRACLSKLAVQWSDMLDGYRNGGQKSQAARERYKTVQAGHKNYRNGPSSAASTRTEQRLHELRIDFLNDKKWRKADKELLRRRGMIGAGDQLTDKGKRWVEDARYWIESGQPG